MTDFDPAEDQLVIMFSITNIDPADLQITPSADGSATEVYFDNKLVASLNGAPAITEANITIQGF